MRDLTKNLVLGVALLATCGGAAQASDSLTLLQHYLRQDSQTNTPGEAAAASFLTQTLRAAGVPSRLLVSASGRVNVYARLDASAPTDPEAGSILLLHHMDVVPPGPGWTREPFSGAVFEDKVFGRGALDAKGLGIAHLEAFLDLHRRGKPLRRGVIFLATADEEAGGGEGARWVLEHHPELFADVRAVLNEGGANRATSSKFLWWGIETAQKRPLWLEAISSGRAGHGSGFQPQSATHRLINALARLLARPVRWRVTPAVREYLAAVAPLHNDSFRSVFADIDAAIMPEGPRANAKLMPGMANLFLDSVQVTVVEAGDTINSIPAEARAKIDIRLLPDSDDEALLAEVRAALGEDIETRVLLRVPPSPPSPSDTAVFREIAAVLRPEAPVVPVFVYGMTDSRHFRERGIPAYGFFPFVLAGDEMLGIHGPDESLPVAELERGVERMKNVVAALALSAER